MRYGDLKWPEIAQLDKDQMVVICPLASLEQHGHHLPLLTDTYLVSGVAERVHDRLADQTLLVPTMWLGASDHHLDFPGTLSLPNSVYETILRSLLTGFVQAGFRRILLLNGHGGNVAPGESAITQLADADDRFDEIHLAFASYWTAAPNAMDPERHGMATRDFTHACEYETSMMLFLHGHLVALDQAVGQVDGRWKSPPGVRVAGRFHRKTASGALGRPELGTAEKGESLVNAISEEVAELVKEILNWPNRPILKPSS